MSALIVVAGLLSVLGAAGVVLSPRPIYSALSLVWSIGMLAVIYLGLNAQFLFAVQLIVYAGAVMVLFVFIIALLSPSSEDRVTFGVRSLIAFIGIVAITATLVMLARNGITYNAAIGANAASLNQAFHADSVGTGNDPYHAFSYDPQSVNDAGNVQTVGGQLFTTFVMPFEITSLLLLVAAVGAVYLTRRAPKVAA